MKKTDRFWTHGDEPLSDPEVVESLAAEAERGYDHPRVEFLHRPPEASTVDLRRIVLRVPPRLRVAAQKLADEGEQSLADLVTEALREHLKRARAAKRKRA